MERSLGMMKAFNMKVEAKTGQMKRMTYNTGSKKKKKKVINKTLVSSGREEKLLQPLNKNRMLF